MNSLISMGVPFDSAQGAPFIDFIGFYRVLRQTILKSNLSSFTRNDQQIAAQIIGTFVENEDGQQPSGFGWIETGLIDIKKAI
jgi:hypothetical protein